VPRIFKRPLDLVLVAISLSSVATLFLAHEDPFARKAFCAFIGSCPTFAHAKAWEKIFYDLAVGALVSLIFYVLIVRLPDFQKRRRFRSGLVQQYKSFRRDCVALMLSVADGSYDGDLPDKLQAQDSFREYFKEQVTADQTRWDRFINNLDQYRLNELIARMEILRDEISFILNNVDIPGDDNFAFLKRFSAAIYLMRSTTLGYDDKKKFGDFLWQLFAGWDWITGYWERDIVQHMIDTI
jgi:hypothetical protein